jgi:hypothetical protein
MPPTVTAAAITDGYRSRLTLVRDATADALAGLLEGVDLNVTPGSLERQLQAWDQRALTLITASSEQAAALSTAYLPAFIRAGGGAPSVELAPAAVDPPDLSVVRSALLWRLGRLDGRGAAMHTATGTARRIARTTVSGSAVQTVARGIDVEPAISSWHRVTGRSCCSRCAALARHTYPSSSPMRSPHPGDRCTPEPVLAGIREAFMRRAPLVVAA